MNAVLSGPFDTAQLPKIAAEPVTITVARSVLPGWEQEYLRWAAEVVSAVVEFPGCLGAGLLHPGPEGGDYQTVFRFVDGLHLRAWERSPERAELMAKAAWFITSERIQRTVGVESFFDLPARAEPRRPLWKRILVDIAWVYPVSLLLALVVAPGLTRLPVLARVLVSAFLVTIALRLVVGPVRSRLRARRRL
jgi:antibiotic biosynthesis monooxygenase (ABM) superfamily enzyme